MGTGPAGTRGMGYDWPMPVPPSPVGRNDPCPSGSGNRYKHCHGAAPPSADDLRPRDQRRHQHRAPCGRLEQAGVGDPRARARLALAACARRQPLVSVGPALSPANAGRLVRPGCEDRAGTARARSPALRCRTRGRVLREFAATATAGTQRRRKRRRRSARTRRRPVR